MSTKSTEPNETSSPTLAIKEWCPGEIQRTRTHGLTAVISTRLDDEKNAYIRCDVAGGSAFAEGKGEEKALERHIASFQSFLDNNQDTIRRAYLYGLRRLDNTSELGAHDDNKLLLVSQDLVNLLPLLHSPDLPKMPRDGISYRFAYPEFFQFHENSFSGSQQEDEVDKARLKLPLTRGRRVKETYLSKILDPEFVPNRPHRSAFWESGSKTEKTEYSRRDFTAELYPTEVTRAETNYRKKLSEIGKRRNERAKSAGCSPSRSSAGSRHSTRASSPSHSGSYKPDQRFGHHLDVPESAPLLPLTQRTSAQLDHHTGNQHIDTPQASTFRPGRGNGPTMQLDGGVWDPWPNGAEFGIYHTPASKDNVASTLAGTDILQGTSYVPQVRQSMPHVHGLTDSHSDIQPISLNLTHLETSGVIGDNSGKQAVAEVLTEYPTWDPRFEMEHWGNAVNAVSKPYSQSHTTPLSEASPYQASQSNTANIDQWPADPPIAEYLQPLLQYAGSTTYSGYDTHAIGHEPNVQSFEWPPVGSGLSLDPNLDDQQRRSHHYPPQ